MVPFVDRAKLEIRRRFGRLILMFGHKLRGGQVPQGAVRTLLVVVAPPRFDHVLRVRDGRELMHVQTFVAPLPVERFDVRVLDGSPRPNEVELYAALIRPVLEQSFEFGSVRLGFSKKARELCYGASMLNLKRHGRCNSSPRAL